jgi:hypothetical protein
MGIAMGEECSRWIGLSKLFSNFPECAYPISSNFPKKYIVVNVELWFPSG